MNDLSFNSFFHTTNMGLPVMSPLPASIGMSLNYYNGSIIIEAMFIPLFLVFFILSVIRVVKKIKNVKFAESGPIEEEKDLDEEEKKNQEEAEQNLIYRFDEQQEEEKEEEEEEDEGEEKAKKKQAGRIEQGEEEEKTKNNAKQSQERNKQLEGEDEKEKDNENAKQDASEGPDDYQEFHDEKQQFYINLDQKLLFFQPFLIIFFMCNSLFVADYMTIAFFGLTVLSYVLFNLIGILSKIKVASLLFMVFALAGFVPLFINDHDLTTA